MRRNKLFVYCLLVKLKQKKASKVVPPHGACSTFAASCEPEAANGPPASKPWAELYVYTIYNEIVYIPCSIMLALLASKKAIVYSPVHINTGSFIVDILDKLAASGLGPLAP